MKTNRMWTKRAAILSAIAAFVLAAQGAFADDAIVYYGDSHQAPNGGGDDLAEFEVALKANPCPKDEIAAELGTYTFDAKGELGVTKGEGTIALRFDVDKPIYNITYASVEINAYDVDYPIDYSNPEHDVVYFNGKKIGRLTGVNNGWRRNTFSVNGSLIKTPSASGEKMSNSLDIHVDIGDGNWITQIGQATLTIKGELRGFDAPKNFKATDLNFMSHPLGVYMSWDKVKNAKYYNVYRDESGNGNWKYLKTVSGGLCLDLPIQGQKHLAANYRVCVASGDSVNSLDSQGNTVLSQPNDVSDFSNSDFGEWWYDEKPEVDDVGYGGTTPFCVVSGDTLTLYVWLNEFSDLYEVQNVEVSASRFNPSRKSQQLKSTAFREVAFRVYRVSINIPYQDAHGDYSVSATVKYKKRGALWGSTSSDKTFHDKILRVFFEPESDDGLPLKKMRTTQKNGLCYNWFRYWNDYMDKTVPSLDKDVWFNVDLPFGLMGPNGRETVFGGYTHSDGRIEIGRACVSIGRYTEPVSGVTFCGATKVDNTSVHEKRHRYCAELRDGLCGNKITMDHSSGKWYRKKFLINKYEEYRDWQQQWDGDGDGLSTDFENGLGVPHGSWAMASKRFDVGNRNTFRLGGSYWSYGDEEAYVRWYAAEHPTVKTERDWSWGGYLDDAREHSFVGKWDVSFGASVNAAVERIKTERVADKENVCYSYEWDELPDFFESPEIFDPQSIIMTGVTIEKSGNTEHSDELTVSFGCQAADGGLYAIKAYLVDSDTNAVARAVVNMALTNTAVQVSLGFDASVLSKIKKDFFLYGITIENALAEASMPVFVTNFIPNNVFKNTDFKPDPIQSIWVKNVNRNSDSLDVVCGIDVRENNTFDFKGTLYAEENTYVSMDVNTNISLSVGEREICFSFKKNELYKSQFTNSPLNGVFEIHTGDTKNVFSVSNVITTCSFTDFRTTNTVVELVLQSVTNDFPILDADVVSGIKIPIQLVNHYGQPICCNIRGVLTDTNHIYKSQFISDVEIKTGQDMLMVTFPIESVYDGEFFFEELTILPQESDLQSETYRPGYKTHSYSIISRENVNPLVAILDPHIMPINNGEIRMIIPVVCSSSGKASISAVITDASGQIVSCASNVDFEFHSGTNTTSVVFSFSNMPIENCNMPCRVDSISVSTKGGIVFEATRKDLGMTIESFFEGIPQRGLSYQLDASCRETINTNNNSAILQFVTTDGRHCFDAVERTSPIYLPDAFNGRGAIRFGYDAIGGTNASTRMVTDSALDHQTVFIVCRPTESQNSYAGLWGEDESIFGLNLSGSAVLKNGFVKNGELYLNGKHCDDNAAFTVGEPLIITAVNDELQTFDVALGNIHNSTNYPLRYFKGELAEIIAYNRKLPAAERKQVESHLKKKWITGVDEVAFAQEDALVTSVAQAFDIDVIADTEWHLSSDQNWITPTAILGTNTTAISLNIAANTTGANRTAILTLSNDVSVATLKLVQYKDGYLEKSINFLPPVTISGTADVKTEGTLVYAFGVWNAVTVNGVAFQSGSSVNAGCFSFGNVSWYGGNYGANTTTPWYNLPSSYRTLLTSAFSCRTVYMNNLEVGQPYMVQIWSNNSTSNGVGRTMVVESGFNSRTLKTNSTDAYGGVGQYVVGYFIADSTQKAFTIGGGDCFFNAIQLRKVSSIPAARVRVTDSVAPAEDRVVQFGDVSVGLDKTEYVTIENASTTSTLTIESVSTCYAENFDDGMATGWDFDNAASWSVENGQLKASNPARTGFMAATYGAATYSDMAVQVDCWRDGNSGNSCGLFLRASPDCGEDGTGYEFFIAENGAYSVWRSVRGSTTSLQGWTSSGAIVVGTNTLLACAQGENLSFYINGKLVWAGKDAEIKSGRIGVGGYTTTDVPTTYWFDNLIQDAPIPLEGVEDSDFAASDWSGHNHVGTPPDFKSEESEILSQQNVKLNAEIGQGVFAVIDVPSFPCSIPCGGKLTFGIRFAPVGFGAVGSSVRIKTDDVQNGDVNVSLLGCGTRDSIRLVPDTGFRFIGTLGGPFTPDCTSYVITNASASACAWDVVEIPEWMSASHQTGTVAPFETEEIVFTPNANASALVKGVYYGTIAISNKNTTLVTSRIGTLEVRQTAALAVSPDTIVVTNRMGETKTVPVTISNAAGADVALTATLDAYETGRDIMQSSGEASTSSAKASSLSQPGKGEFHLPPGVEFRDRDVLLKFDSSAESVSAQEDVLSAIGGATIIRRYKLVPGLVLARIPEAIASSEKMEALVQRINGMRGIAYAHPNYKQKAIAIPNDELFDQL